MSNKSFIKQELRKSNINKMLECPKCKCYNKNYKCIVCNTILNPTNMKVMHKEETILLAIQKAMKKLKSKIFTNNQGRYLLYWSDVEEVFGK